MEKWKKVLIAGSDGREFLNSIHGKLGCVSCHGGQEEASDMDAAHKGMISDPSAQAGKYCAGCHGEVVGKHMNSIHKNQNGYFTFFSLRYQGTPDGPIPHEFTEEFNQECGACHTTCGQCHVSVPKSARGGLIRNHKFNKTPDMTKNCTACHGSRIGDEFLGNNEGMSADVHWAPNLMRCEDCHSGEEMHGTGEEVSFKLQVELMPRCEECHQNQESNIYHTAHWGDLSCSVCHAQPYRNCNSCHVGGDGITGDPYFEIKIGKNPVKVLRGYEWVTLRHIPITHDTYANWGFTDLPSFDVMPTWKYTMPHNVQKNTPQTVPDTTGASQIACAGSCHENEEIFLRPSDISQEETEANKNVVVKDEEWPVGP